MRRRRFVALDRDGTLIVERRYLSDPQQVTLLPGVAALRRLQTLGLRLVVITNQSAVGRGFFDEARLHQIHRRLRALLRAEGVRLDAIYVCPHRPEDDCACRKPQPALLLRAARELACDPRDSFVVGDNICDIELGRRVGAPTVLIRTGYGARVAAEELAEPDYIVTDLPQAVRIIERLLKTSTRSRRSVTATRSDQ